MNNSIMSHRTLIAMVGVTAAVHWVLMAMGGFWFWAFVGMAAIFAMNLAILGGDMKNKPVVIRVHDNPQPRSGRIVDTDKDHRIDSPMTASNDEQRGQSSGA